MMGEHDAVDNADDDDADSVSNCGHNDGASHKMQTLRNTPNGEAVMWEATECRRIENKMRTQLLGMQHNAKHNDGTSNMIMIMRC